MQLRQTSRGIASLLESDEVLAILSLKYSIYNANSIDVLFQRYDKVGELIDAIRADDAEAVLLILKYSKSDYLIPSILSIAAILHSTRVYVAVCPLMVHDLNQLVDNMQDLDDTIQVYLANITKYTLASSNASMYRAYFEALSNTTTGVELFYEAIEGPDYVDLSMFYSYSYYLMTNNDEALRVIQEFFEGSPEKLDPLKEGYNYIGSLDFLRWLVRLGKYTIHEIEDALWMNPAKRFGLKNLMEETTYDNDYEDTPQGRSNKLLHIARCVLIYIYLRYFEKLVKYRYALVCTYIR